MSSRRSKRRRREAPMPATGAGLLRFFGEETPGIRVRPEVIVVLAVSFIVACILASMAF